MPEHFRPVAFRLLALALFAALATHPAQAAGGYTAIGIGTTQASACSSATASVNSHCAMYGTITTTPLGCIPIYNGSGTFVGYLCHCEASTGLCLNPGPTIPFP